MSDTPRTDAVLKELSTMKIRYNAWSDASFISEYARQLERELSAKDENIASLRAQLSDADREMARLHRLEDACEKLILRLMTEEQSRIVWMTEEYLSPIRENLKQRFPYQSSSEWNKRASK